MPDISFCFYGQVKNYNKEIYDSFMDCVFNPISKFYKPKNIYNYLFTYNNKNIYNPRNNENHYINFSSIFDYIKFNYQKIISIESKEVVNIDRIATESAFRYGNSWCILKSDSIISLKNAIRQLYCLSLAYKKLNSNHINIIIRPDVQFLNKINLLESYNNLDLLVPSFATFTDYCNDRFAICLNDKALYTYCNRFKFFLDLEYSYNSEHFLMFVIKENKIRYGLIDLDFVRIRANGIVDFRDNYLLDKKS